MHLVFDFHGKTTSRIFVSLERTTVATSWLVHFHFLGSYMSNCFLGFRLPWCMFPFSRLRLRLFYWSFSRFQFIGNNNVITQKQIFYLSVFGSINNVVTKNQWWVLRTRSGSLRKMAEACGKVVGVGVGMLRGWFLEISKIHKFNRKGHWLTDKTIH